MRTYKVKKRSKLIDLIRILTDSAEEKGYNCRLIGLEDNSPGIPELVHEFGLVIVTHKTTKQKWVSVGEEYKNIIETSGNLFVLDTDMQSYIERITLSPTKQLREAATLLDEAGIENKRLITSMRLEAISTAMSESYKIQILYIVEQGEIETSSGDASDRNAEEDKNTKTG